jgi:O-antigen ligase
MLAGQHFTHDLLQALTGYAHPRGIEQRLGLTRAYGTFDHPIHLGTFCASVVAMIWYGERDPVRRGFRLSLVSLATLTALSSAPLLCILFQVLLLVWERATRGLPARVSLSLAVLAALYIGATLVGTRSPVALIATGLTLDSWTGYYRLLIWEHGLENVWANPWIGIGLADWTRPQWMVASTVDAMWLVIAMRGGVPAIAMVVLAVVLLARAAGRRGDRAREASVRRFSRGWLISLVALCLAACTVHYWNAIYAYFFFFLGLGGCFADPRRLRRRAEVRPLSMRNPGLPVAAAGALVSTGRIG